MATSKANYKVFNKFTKKYVGNGRKKVWQMEWAVLDFIKNSTEGCYARFNIDNLEIHKFPLDTVVILDPRKFITEVGERLSSRDAKKIQKSSDYEKEYLIRKKEELEAELEKLKKEIASK
jgi:hypothetical protein